MHNCTGFLEEHLSLYEPWLIYIFHEKHHINNYSVSALHFTDPHLFSALFHCCSPNFSEPLWLTMLFSFNTPTLFPFLFWSNSLKMFFFLFWQWWKHTFLWLYHKSNWTCLLSISNMDLPNKLSIVGWLISCKTTLMPNTTQKKCQKIP